MYQNQNKSSFSFGPPNNILHEPVTSTISDKKTKLIYFNEQPPKVKRDSYQITVSSSSELHKDSDDGLSSSIWRANFIIVFIPLLIWGFPIHLLFRKRRIYSMRDWLKYLCPCSSPLSSILTMLLVVISVLLNITVIYALGKLIYIVLIKAVITSDDVLDLLGGLLRLVPVVIPLDMFWLWGYKLRNFVGSFDRVAALWKPIDGDGTEFAQIGTRRMKLALIYIMIICAHVLHYLSDFYHDDKPDLSSQSIANQVWEVTMVYSTAILATLVLPIYCCFCWAVHYELEMTKEYIRSLVLVRVTPNYTHFDEFKKMSRKITDDILMINSIFSILFSVVVVILGVYIFGEVQNLGIIIANEAVATYTGKSKEAFDPGTIRLIFGDILIILLYVGLLGLTIYQAIVTNDAMRGLHVWLNDFVTEPNSRLSQDLHGSVSSILYHGLIHTN